MRFIKMEIEEFGKLTDFSLTLGEGLNLVEGKNESGKSTLLAFLRFALYSFPRRNSEGGDERDKRLSWRNRRAAGSLTLSHGGEEYRITRTFTVRGTAAREVPSESLSVVRISDGQKISLDGKTPGEYFLGLPAELYDSSLCLSQSDAARVASPAVREAVGDLLFSGESTLCAEGAEAKLQAARRDLQHQRGRGGRIAALEDEQARLDLELSKARDDAARLAAMRAESHRCRAALQQQRDGLYTVSAALERAGIEQTLSLFEARDRAAAEERTCRAALDTAEQQLAALPDRNAASRVALALRDAENARENVARVAPEVARLETVQYNEKLLRTAARVREQGGAPLLLAKHAKLSGGAKRLGIAALILLLLGALCALPALLFSELLLYAAAGGGALLLAACFTLLLSLGKRRRAKRLVAELGAVDTVMLRTYLEQCERERASYEAHLEHLARLQGELASARQVEAGATERLRTEFSVFGTDPRAVTPEIAHDLLTALNERRTAAEQARERALLAFEKAKGARETLAERLAAQDEAALRARRDALPATGENAEALQSRQALLQHAVREAEAKVAEAERAESALAATAHDPEALARERGAIVAELDAARRRLAAIGMALSALGEATEDLRRGITPRLREDASRIFRELTEGAYEGLVLGNDFSISLMAGGEPMPLSRFSAGCRDAAHLSLRLALLSTLTDERLPLLLDEAFSRLDDDRAAALLSILQGYARAGGQVLLFTCHSRERVMLADDPATNAVELL